MADGIFGGRPSLPPQQFKRSERYSAVFVLKWAGQRGLDILEIESEAMVVEAMGRRMRVIGKLAADHKRRTLALRRNRSQGETCLRVAGADYHRHPWFDDAALFRRDGRDGVAQPFHVVEADRGYYAEQRPQDVSRIEPSAQTGFNHRDVNCGLGKIEKHQGDGDFKKGESQAGPLQ